MTKKTSKVLKERRKHVRLPILHGILEPVEIEFYTTDQHGKNVPQPAILVDLSAGGMRLITFMPPPHTKELNIVLKLAGIKKGVPLTGKISWVKEKGGVYMNGISFSTISHDDRKMINEMAEDYSDCDTRMALKLPEVCVDTCRGHGLCNKPQKNEALFKKK
ncbi:MAG TPA: PilZ domain-containing protein [Elusimicrobiales bacterium]|nr:PilZ domain-containing protein [Elusimicrobiales bacterium]